MFREGTPVAMALLLNERDKPEILGRTPWALLHLALITARSPSPSHFSVISHSRLLTFQVKTLVLFPSSTTSNSSKVRIYSTQLTRYKTEVRGGNGTSSLHVLLLSISVFPKCSSASLTLFIGVIMDFITYKVMTDQNREFPPNYIT